MKRKPEYVEGNQAVENFENAMDTLMKISHEEIKKQLDAEKAAKSFKPAKHKRRKNNQNPENA